MLVGGTLIGNRGRRKAMSDRSRDQLDRFRELLDAILIALLFVLTGFQALVLPRRGPTRNWQLQNTS